MRIDLAAVNKFLRSWAVNANAEEPSLVDVRAAITGHPDPTKAACVSAFDTAGKFHVVTGPTLPEAFAELRRQCTHAAA